MKTIVFQEKILIALLAVVLLFTGCDPSDNDFIDDGQLNQGLIGKWEFDYGFGKEEYTITETTLIYHDDFAGIWGGSIVHISNYSNSSGVIIIEYDSDKKQQWTNWTTMEDITPSGNFYGIYFSDLTANTVVFSNTNDQSNNYGPTETETLEEAKNKFTLGKRGDYISPGAGTPQTRVY